MKHGSVADKLVSLRLKARVRILVAVMALAARGIVILQVGEEEITGVGADPRAAITYRRAVPESVCSYMSVLL